MSEFDETTPGHERTPSPGAASIYLQPGQRIGSYRLLECLGSGGMGQVWRAEQLEPVQRVVAIKFIKAGMDSSDLIARFESERQALAMMDHPCIARVLEAGTTPEGRPYFVMEYVAGLPIIEYCDRHRLNTRERLALFQRCCEGVQHAHQKAVLHRDLKPGNILVTELDGRPVPKIIDFGLAKALSRRLTDSPMFTALGETVGTLEYMSPEQADAHGEDVDTRSDVYSLGVILYQLLVGVLPFDPDELRKAGFEGARKVLLERDPPRPSSRISSVQENSKIIAASRRTDPGQLGHDLKGDLDWIVLRALEKNRNRRYDSPRELAQDIQRHVDNVPVIARPPSLGYHAGKFARRHRTAVLAGGAAVVLLVAFAVSSAVQADHVRRERDRATEAAARAGAMNEFLRTMLTSADPWSGGEHDLTVVQALDAAAKSLDTAFPHQPLVEADMRAAIGSTYLALGKVPPATEQTQRALKLRLAALGPDAAEVAEAWDGMGEIDRDDHAYGAAEAAAREALRIRQRLHPRPDSVVVRAQLALARCLELEHRLPQADSLLGRVEQTFPGLRTDTRGQRAELFSMRADIAQERGDLVAADSLVRESLQLQREVNPRNPEVMVGQNNLAIYRMQRGDLRGARELLEQTLATEEDVLGENHPTYAMSLENLANVDFQENHYDTTLERLARVRDIRARNLGEDHIEVTRTMQNMAVVANASGDHERALKLFEQVLPRFRAKLGEGDPETATCERNMSNVLRALRRYRECDELLQQSLATYRKSYGDAHPQVARTRAEMGQSFDEQRRWQDAIVQFNLALPRLREAYGDNSKRTKDAAAGLVKAYDALGEAANARRYRDLAGK